MRDLGCRNIFNAKWVKYPHHFPDSHAVNPAFLNNRHQCRFGSLPVEQKMVGLRQYKPWEWSDKLYPNGSPIDEPGTRYDVFCVLRNAAFIDFRFEPRHFDFYELIRHPFQHVFSWIRLLKKSNSPLLKMFGILWLGHGKLRLVGFVA